MTCRKGPVWPFAIFHVRPRRGQADVGPGHWKVGGEFAQVTPCLVGVRRVNALVELLGP